MRKIRSVPGAFLLLCSVLLLTACDQTFEPLGKNDKYHFSIYGYLDAAADTQWVRVERLRQAINDSPDSTGIQVTLEHVQSGDSVIMYDSLFSSNTFLNYWTTFDIENEQTYRIEVKDKDGKRSWVSVTTPREIPAPIVIESQTRPRGFYIYIDDSVEKIADVQSRWYVFLNPRTEAKKRIYSFGHRHSLEHSAAYGGSYVAFASTADASLHIRLSSGNANRNIVHRQLFIAAGGPEWDENISSIDDLEYFLNETTSNVEDGLGYVIGIDSKLVSLKTCLNPEGSNISPCPEEKSFW